MLDRVPYEIFSKIIKLSCMNSSYITFLFDVDEMALPPIGATHVCRSWRTALLSDPTMWTCIRPGFTGRGSGEPTEMLIRSGSAPLNVFIDICSPSQYVDLFNIRPHIHRFRSLQMLISTRFAYEIFCLLGQPAPILQKLHLRMHESKNGRKRAILPEAYQNLLLGSAPNLEHAHLQISAGLKELQSVSLFKNLSTLHLYFVSSMVIDGDILLGILHSSPCLRILNILWSYSSTIVCPTPSHHRIPLPCLQKLSLQGTCKVDNVDFILGCLDFIVEKVDFDITCNDFHPKISHSRLLLHFLARRRLSLFSISSSFWADIMAIEFFEEVGLGFPKSSPRPKESSVFRVLYNRYAPSYSLSHLLRKLKMSDITHMYLETIASYYAALKRILLQLDNLQHLHVKQASWNEDYQGPRPKSYLEILMSETRMRDSNCQIEAASDSDDGTESEPDDEASPAHLFPCPSLHTLELAFADPVDESYIQELIQCSKIREQAGHPFKSVTIYCRCSDFAESARTWLQTHELGRVHIEVALWSITC